MPDGGKQHACILAAVLWRTVSTRGRELLELVLLVSAVYHFGDKHGQAIDDLLSPPLFAVPEGIEPKLMR
jgi:hypothetical protein